MVVYLLKKTIWASFLAVLAGFGFLGLITGIGTIALGLFGLFEFPHFALDYGWSWISSAIADLFVGNIWLRVSAHVLAVDFLFSLLIKYVGYWISIRVILFSLDIIVTVMSSVFNFTLYVMHVILWPIRQFYKGFLA